MYMHNWAETQLQGLTYDFHISEADLDGVEILLAAYEYEDYDGHAVVIFKKDNQLWSVYGSHCSCYGLEGQWDPEESSISQLEHMLEKGWQFNWIADEVRTLVKRLDNEVRIALGFPEQ
ncbi:hypothetical protein D3C81_226180 [compost metagenome]